MQARIKDSDLKIFSQDAKKTMSEHLQNYAEHLKTEAERIAVAHYGSADAKVTKDIVDGVIKTQGHHVNVRPSFFYSYVLPIIESLSGGFLCNVLCVKNKTVWSGIIIATCIALIVGGIFMSRKHEKGR